MVGGPEDVFEKAKPVMATMGKVENLILCGGPGAGLATKQINNYVAYCSYVALCEGESHPGSRREDWTVVADGDDCRHEHWTQVWTGPEGVE